MKPCRNLKLSVPWCVLILKEFGPVYGSLMFKFELQRALSFNPPLLGWTIVQF